jgi:hypothetical protein
MTDLKPTKMKATTLKNRLEKIENLSRNSKGYQVVNNLISNNPDSMIFGNLIRPCHTSGKGRFTTNLDYTDLITHLLNKIGVKYIKGSDAPRGGKTGHFLKIITKIQ